MIAKESSSNILTGCRGVAQTSGQQQDSTFAERGLGSFLPLFSSGRRIPGGRNAAVHPDGVRGGRGKRGQSERAAANEDVESSGARKMGRPAFHPPPGAKGEGKGARSRVRVGSEGGRGIEVGSVGSQPCAPVASLVMLFALYSPRIALSLFHVRSPSRFLSAVVFGVRCVARAYVFSEPPARSTFAPASRLLSASYCPGRAY